MKVTYSSNNSGGRWWLKDEDWKKLEAAGWTVNWVKDDKNRYIGRDPGNERWLGALATEASIEVESIDVAIAKWEYVTGKDAFAKGCSCCGQPHNFSDFD